MRLDLAHVLAESLERLGVERIYGLIGTSILDFVDALYDYRDVIRFITTRHEQVAVSMADAEARLRTFPGVAVVHVGGGFLNSLIGLGIAYKDSSPLVLISGGVRSRLVGLDSMYEIDQLSMVEPITKARFRVDDVYKVPDVVREAFRTALSPPPGPVFIEVPEDMWMAKGEFNLDGYGLGGIDVPAPEEEAVDEVIEYIKRSERPVILVGGGVNNQVGSRLLLELVNYIGAPVVSTGNGRGAFPEVHPFSLGRVGFGGGSTYADRALEEADLVLAFGCALSDITTYSYTLNPRGDVVIVGLNRLAEVRPSPYSLFVYGDANIFLDMLVRRLSSEGLRRDYSGWWGEIRGWRRAWEALLDDVVRREYTGFVSPGRFFKRLGESIDPSKTIITAGQGMHILYTYAFMRVGRPRGFLAATDLGAMGFAYPAALSAKLVEPDNEVICVVGDGEFMMTVQDLETAVREGINVKIIVVNDNSYRVLYYRQRIQKGGRLLGTLLGNPDFVKLAESFGVMGMRLDNNSGIDDAIMELLSFDGPYLLELWINPDDAPPLNLEASLRMTSL